jgi:glucose dehydrogenase
MECQPGTQETFALDAATGNELWKTSIKNNGHNQRGVTYLQTVK